MKTPMLGITSGDTRIFVAVMVWLAAVALVVRWLTKRR
jgi:hypothetical protein